MNTHTHIHERTNTHTHVHNCTHTHTHTHAHTHGRPYIIIRQWQYLNQINEFEASTKLQTALQFTYISHSGYFSWCKIVMEAVTLCITIVGKCFNIEQAKSYYTWGNLIEPIMFACCALTGRNRTRTIAR